MMHLNDLNPWRNPFNLLIKFKIPNLSHSQCFLNDNTPGPVLCDRFPEAARNRTSSHHIRGF